MRKGGLFVLDNHCNRISLTGFLGNVRKRFTINPDDPYKLYQLLTQSEFNYELRSAGFTHCKRMYSFLPAISRFGMFSASSQQRIDQCLVKLPILRPFADLIVVALQK